jgi:hypothetical protein
MNIKRTKKKKGAGLFSKSEDKDEANLYNSMTTEITTSYEGDEIKVNLKPNQIVLGLNLSVYCRSSGLKGAKKAQYGEMIQLKRMGEEAVLPTYKATRDDDFLIGTFDKLNKETKRESVVTHRLDDKDSCMIFKDSKKIIAITGNIDFDFQYNLRGLISKADVRTVRADKNGKGFGFIWSLLPNYKKVEINEGNSIVIDPDEFICALIPNKNSYHIRKPLFSLFKTEKDYIQLEGPCILYRNSHDIDVKKLHFIEKYKMDLSK